MISLCFMRIRLRVLTTNHPMLVRLFYLVFSLVLLVGVSHPYAEIYRWRDDEGVVRFSNSPPEDRSQVLDVIPTRRVPLVQDDSGAVYYLNIPDTKLTQDMPVQEVLEQLTLPPDVLEELLQDAPQDASSAGEVFTGDGDLTMLTFRLAELEEALEREIMNRLEWEQQYLKAQSQTEALKQQNQTLQTALADMGTKMEKIQKAVARSEIHVSALRDPQQQIGKLEHQLGELHAYISKNDTQQELGKLEDKLVHLQSYVTDMNVQTGQRTAKVTTAIKDFQTTQEQRLATLSTNFQNRLTDLQTVQSEKITEFSAKLQEVDTIKTRYEQQLVDLSTKLENLEGNIETLTQFNLSTQVDVLTEKLIMLEKQPPPVQSEQIAQIQAKLHEFDSLSGKLAMIERQQPVNDLHVKLAALQTDVDNLTNLLPGSSKTSQVAAKLFEQEHVLKTVTAHQNWQIREQRTQIEQLQAELGQLKTQVNSSRVYPEIEESSQKILPAAEAERQQKLAAVLEKNAFMEAIIKHQGKALNLQKDRLQAVEVRLEQLLNSQKDMEQVPNTNIAPQQKSPPSGRIRVVERKVRRNKSSVRNQDDKKCSIKFELMKGFYQECTL